MIVRAYDKLRGHKEHLIHKGEAGKYLRSIVLGGLDGLITTFAVVTGVAGASLSWAIIIILGVANLLADGISMSVGNYLATKSEIEYNMSEKKREEEENVMYPKKEKKEMIHFYIKRGMKKTDAIKVVNILFRNKNVWMSEMMKEEFGITEREHNEPIKNAAVTFISFVGFGSIPLISYVFADVLKIAQIDAFGVAAGLTFSSIFALGAAKVFLTGRNWLKSGLEMLFVGGAAAASAYYVGYLLAFLA
ncbi:MAG: VIT1/CCC1 transporter family protein [Candidatus Aenigmarchaeota archaeon]|nr:VIT1/CCC1 transporter family protein [Candidatus Aenigmarchaeota archaeon]